MKIDITKEINFKTARSGGKGGQNVNKVETMVEGRWHIGSSIIANDEQKKLITEKLSNRITDDGYLLVKSQQSRTQMGNKEIVIFKMNELINNSLQKKKLRIATKIPQVVIEKRIESNKIKSHQKQTRKKINPKDL